MRYLTALLAFSLVFFSEAGLLAAEELTLGLVQSKIKKGMSQGEVAGAIGSPNIASKDRDGNEVWIYDKISSETETESSGEKKDESSGEKKDKSSGFSVGGGGLFGALGGIIGIGGGFGSKGGKQSTREEGKENTREKSKVKSTKKTLTVVIKFDKRSLVKEVNYHMSKF